MAVLISISTHAPLTGRDLGIDYSGTDSYDFYSRAPHGTRLDQNVVLLIGYAISTHAPLTGRDTNGGTKRMVIPISTHAPLTGRDGETANFFSPLHS